MTDKCMWCDRPATRYCDAPIGFEAKGAERNTSGTVRQLLIGSDSRMWTCDAPMCSEHAQQVGFVCGEEPDSIDYCPHCRENTRRIKEMVMFEDEATAARRRVHAEIRRSRMAETNKEQA